MMVEAQLDADFAVDFAAFVADRRELVRRILIRGVDRGELAADIDLDTAVDTVFGPFWYRLLSPHAPLTAGFADQLARQVVRGIRRDR